MPLLQLRDIYLAFGGPYLLEGINLTLEPGQRIGLLGRNGAGKSSLLRLLAGQQPQDAGQRHLQQGIRCSYLSQELPTDLTGSVYQQVAGGLGDIGTALYQLHAAGKGHMQLATDKLSRLQQQLEEAEAWPLQGRITEILSGLGLDGETSCETLSGGMQRRVLLARTLVAQPDVLLLDEPTNHLDITTIQWLEEYLRRSRLSLMFVTHDRAFLRRVANRIVELDRGQLYDFATDYDTFVQRKEELLAAEAKAQEQFERKLSQEEAWIRQGLKARRKRNMGRVRALERMRAEKRQRRQASGQVNFQLAEAQRSGAMVVEVANLTFAYEDKPIVKDFSCRIMRGDRVGIIGPNGAGKTTLVRLLLGELSPNQGTVRLGTNLQIIYFDQLREQLDPQLTVKETLCGDQDTVMVGDTPKHVYGYLQDFLFSPQRARSPVASLSGGERNRLLLARLFTRPANVLVLDEPTNDLDLETLELLQEQLAEFTGTLFLVSHDRDFLNRTVTSVLGMEGDGRITEAVGGFDEWLARRQQQSEAPQTAAPAQEKPARQQRQRPRKLSFHEKQQLQQLPQQIEELEEEQAHLQQQLSDPDFYRQQGEQAAAHQQRLEAIEKELEELYSQWQELEALS